MLNIKIYQNLWKAFLTLKSCFSIFMYLFLQIIDSIIIFFFILFIVDYDSIN